MHKASINDNCTTYTKHTSTTPDIHHTMGKIGHLVWRMSDVVDVLCGGGPILHAVWWMSVVVDVWCGGCLVWWMSVWWMSVWWMSYNQSDDVGFDFF